MNSLEDRLRASLHAHADEVEPSQELWRETNRRIDRRVRRRTLGWSLAGVAGVATAAAAVFAVMSVTGISPELPVPEIAGVPDNQQPAGPGDPTDEPGTSSDGEVVAPLPQLTASASTIELRDAAGVVIDQLTLPGEGESRILSLAVRPGSTADTLTAAVLTEAEGLVDLRVLRRDADGFGIVAADAGYQPSPGVDPTTVSGPVFSPDGTSLAWLEAGAVATLRVIGWDDDGPGTGSTATDNAAFTLDDVEVALQLHDWVEDTAADGFVLRAVDAASTSWFAIPLQRQADGAWARESGAGVGSIESPDVLDEAGRAAPLEDGALSVAVR